MKPAKSLQQLQPSYLREILSAASAPGVISLAGGLPDATNFPLSLLASSFQGLSTRADLFQYGNTAGYGPLLEHLAQRYDLPGAHSALLCTGSQQGLDLIARAFINAGDTVVMEAPCYLGALQVFTLAQANIQSVTQQDDGPDIGELEACFARQQVKMFYAVPDFHNPTGLSWSLAVRKKVARLCQQYQVTLIEDAPYRELRFKGDDLPLAASFCPDNALLLRSFSKIAMPGIRLGLVTGADDWINALIKVKQAADLHSSMPMQAVLLDLLTNKHFDQHLSQTRSLYQQRYNRLSKELSTQLADICHFKSVNGGMFIWLFIPECDVYQIAKSALKAGVAVVPGDVFYQKTDSAVSALRLNFSNASEDQLSIAVTRLAKVIRAHS